MTTDALWYLARGAGTVSLVLLTVVMVLGVGSRAGRPVFGLPRFGVVSVHRNASLLALGLLLVHLVSLLLDPYAQLDLVNLVVPFGALYRPFWVGLGTLAIDLLVVVAFTSWIRRYLGVRAWRTVHWASYAIWPIALLHGLFSGTDAGQLWLRAIAGTCVLVVTAAVVWRLSIQFAEEGRLRTTVHAAAHQAATEASAAHRAATLPPGGAPAPSRLDRSR